MKLLKQIAYLLFACLLVTSCNDDDDEIIIVPAGDYEHGILITNEGPFGAGTGTVTFISEDYSTLDGEIFFDVNESDLGNIVQSMAFSGDLAFIVVNNSHKIEVVNRYTFENSATITEGLNNPRYLAVAGTTGYVSNWGDPFDETDDFIAVYNISTLELIKTIPVEFGPERIISAGTYIYIAHKGGFGQNNKVTILNTATNEIETVLTVGDVPNSMVYFGTELFVLCGGNPIFTGNETNGSLVKIDIISNLINQTIDFGLTDHPSNLTHDGSTLLYNLNGKVFSMETSSTSLPMTNILEGSFYNMKAKDGKLYATDAGDFASNGTLKIFDLSTNSEIQNIEVGIIPGGIYFND